MSAIAGIDIRCGLTIEVYCGNQPNKTKLVMHTALFHVNSQLYISNKMEHFSYRGRFGI